MSTTIKIKAAGRKFDLTPDEARDLYNELRKVYDMPPDEARALYDELRKMYDLSPVSVTSVWTGPHTFPPFGVMVTTGEKDTYSVSHVRDTIRAEHV